MCIVMKIRQIIFHLWIYLFFYPVEEQCLLAVIRPFRDGPVHANACRIKARDNVVLQQMLTWHIYRLKFLSFSLEV